MLFGTLAYGSAFAVQMVGYLVTVPILTSRLSVQEFGILSWIQAVVGPIATVASLQAHGAVMRYYYGGRDGASDRAELVTSALVVATVGCVVVGFIFEMFGVGLLSHVWKGVAPTPLVRYALWTALVGAVTSIPMSILRIQGRSGLFAALSIAQTLANVGVTIVTLVLVGGGLKAYLVGLTFVSGGFAAGLVGTAVARHRALPSRLAIRRILAYSLPLVPHALTGWLQDSSDRVVLQRYVTSSDLGLYSFAYRFALLQNQAIAIPNMEWAPTFQRLASQGASPGNLARKATHFFALASAMWLAAASVSADGVRLLGSAAYHASVGLLPILTAGYWWRVVYFTSVPGLLACSRTVHIASITGASGAANLLLNLWFVPRYGIQGAAATTVVTLALEAGLIAIASRHYFRLPMEYGRMTVVSAFAWLGYGVSLLLPARGAGWLAVPLHAGLSLGIFAIGVLACGIVSVSAVKGWLSWSFRRAHAPAEPRRV